MSTDSVGSGATNNAYPELNRVRQFFPLGVERPTCLSTAQIDRYNERGYLFPLDVFSSDEIAAVRAEFDALLPKALAAGWSSYQMTNWHKHCPFVWDLATEPRILDYVQDLLGETLILRHSHFFCKLPNDGKRVSWHQDASYWPITPSKVVSVWLAIDDVDEENSALQVIPGSHRNAQLDFEPSAADEQNVLNQTVRGAEHYGDPPVTIALRAGQISLHSDWTLHGSEPNVSSRRRCGLALRYLSSDVRAYYGWNKNSVICRGSDPSGHWVHHSRPQREAIPVYSVQPEHANLSDGKDPTLM